MAHTRCLFCRRTAGDFGPDGPHWMGRCKSQAKPVTKTSDGRIVVSREAAAEIGRKEIAKAVKAETEARGLEKAAKEWDGKARALSSATSDLKTYYQGKARECRTRAVQVRKEMGE